MYQVFKSKTHENKRYIALNDMVLRSAKIRSYEDYEDEVLNKGNEMTGIAMVFVTQKGNKFALWFDTETGETFITKTEEGNEQ